MNLILNLILFTVFLLEFIVAQSPFSVVEIDTGLVKGLILNTTLKSMGYYSFRGIPYAEPPLGCLRFRPPVPKRPWKNIFNAVEDGENCVQMHGKDVIGSEDCLYLNVYTPTLTSCKKLPVMVWIHGGAFRSGTGNSSFYGPDFLIEQNVVVVAMSYRLGALGFLNIDHPFVTGNNGLKDQNLALKWVQRNIHKFGGDPEKVTLIGQSAGGVSVDMHVLSPMSAGLFKRTISMSASPTCFFWPFQNTEEAKTTAFELGYKLSGQKVLDEDHLYAILSRASPDDIVRLTENINTIGIVFRPTAELANHYKFIPNEYFLTEHGSITYRRGNYNKGEHMTGYTSLEALEFAKVLDDVVHFSKVFLENYVEFLFKNVTDVFPDILGINRVPKFLGHSFHDALITLEKYVLTELIKEASDFAFVTGIDRKQRLMSKNNGYPVYYYQFDYKSKYSAHKAVEKIVHLDGVAHEDELPYIFYRPHVNLPLDDPDIKKTRERLVHLWTNFAKYGNPTPHTANNKSEVAWPNSGEEGLMLHISDKLVVTDRPKNIMVHLYQHLCIGESTDGDYACEVMLYEFIKSEIQSLIKSIG